MLSPLLHRARVRVANFEYDIACCALERLYQRWAITRRQYLDGVADAFMQLMRELTR